MDRVLLVGCEVANVDDNIGLSEAVSRSVPAAADLVKRLVEQIASTGTYVESGPAALSRSGAPKRKEAP